MSVGLKANPDGTSGAVQVNGSDVVTVNSAGNVGIGTSSLVAKLDVAGVIQSKPTAGTFPQLTLNSADTGKWKSLIAFQNNGTYKWEVGVDDGNIGSNNLYFYDNVAGSLRAIIDSAGNVGIGTSSLVAKLDVGGTIRSSEAGTDPGSGSAFYFVGSGAFQTVIAGAEFAVHTGANNARAERLRVTSAGTLNSQPTYDNTATGSTVIVTSTGQIRRTSSSIKYKKDVESLDPTLATNAIEGLRPVWYRTKNAEGDDKATWSHIGLIAEEVDLVEPRLVRYRTAEVATDEEGNRTEVELETPEPEDVDYARLSVLLLAEVQSLRDRLAALEARP